MILTLLIVIAAVLALGAMLLLVSSLRAGRPTENLAGQLYAIDIDAFRNLVDEREEEFLREHLPPSDFRKVHRERMLAAAEYVWGAARNASILIRLGEAAKLDSDPGVVAAAESLQENAFRLRLFALHALPRLYVSLVIPGANRAPQALADSYDSVTRQMVRLTCMRSPARVTQAI